MQTIWSIDWIYHKLSYWNETGFFGSKLQLIGIVKQAWYWYLNKCLSSTAEYVFTLYEILITWPFIVDLIIECQPTVIAIHIIIFRAIKFTLTSWQLYFDYMRYTFE